MAIPRLVISNARGVQRPTRSPAATAGWAARSLWTRRWRFARERLIETKRTAGRERCGVGLRRAYWVAQVCHADARDHRRVAKDRWGAGEVVKESNSRAKKNRRDVDMNFVEEASIQELLDGVSAVDPNGLPGGGGFGLVHGAFDAVGHEVDRDRKSVV